MITLSDNDVVGLIKTNLSIAEVLMESLVRKGIFDHSDIEYFGEDVTKAINENIESLKARAVINEAMDVMYEELWQQVDADQKGGTGL